MGSIGESEAVSFPLPQQHPSTTHATLNGHLPTATGVDEPTTPILVIGGGPVGMLLAYTLSHRYNQPCTLVEQSLTTTHYPKMEFTNGRSMEIYHALGLANQLRDLGVPESYDFNEIITTGLADGGKPVTVWERQSPEELRRRSKVENDGTWAREPYLRCSQIAVERWLKGLVVKERGVKSMFGWRCVELREGTDGVLSEFINNEGKSIRIRSQYVVGCDGGGSLVRKLIGVKAERQNLNMNFMFVHIRSRDPRLRSQGRFWHLMTLKGDICVSQDEKDTYTWHFTVPDDTDIQSIDAERAIHEAVGGLLGPCKLKIDEIMVKSIWRSKVAVADRFRSEGGRVQLAGDSAHQFSPVGGHGLNSGIHDLWNLSWKLAAVSNGWGGEALLESYNAERRLVAMKNLAMVEKGTLEVLLPLATAKHRWGAGTLLAENEEGEKARKEVAEMLERGYWLHHQNGTTLGYCYTDSPIVAHEKAVSEPPSHVDKYTPTTWPGGRPPHVWLKDGVTSIFDLLGLCFNVVDFTKDGGIGKTLEDVAQKVGLPLRLIHLPEEGHARNIWERDVVLLRPDQHVAWRLPEGTRSPIPSEEVRGVLALVSGKAH